MVICKSSGLELVPELHVAQFDFGPQTNVAGEQSQHGRLWQRPKTANKFQHPSTDSRLPLVQNVVEPKDISLKEPLKIFRCRRDFVIAEKFAHQAYIGPAGEFQPLEAVHRVDRK